MDLEKRIRDELASRRARSERHAMIVDGYLGSLLVSERSPESSEMPKLPTSLNFRSRLSGVEVTEVPRQISGEAA